MDDDTNSIQLKTREKISLEFQHLKTLFFNSAYFGPSPIRAKLKMQKAMERELDPSFYPYASWTGISDVVRGKIAQLLQCSPDNITHSTSVSDLIGLVANAIPFKEGDLACAMKGDYPSTVLPWLLAEKNLGKKFQLLHHPFPTVDWLKKNLPLNTKVFTISHIAFDSGRMIDLLALGKWLKEREIFFVVDCTQSLGGLPITPEELQYIDVLACSAYKWILGPYGHAFGYFSEKAIKEIPRLFANWLASPHSQNVYHLLDYTLETLPGARKYDRGQTPNMLTMACLEGSLDFLLEIGLSQIQKINAILRNEFLDSYPKEKYQLMTPVDAMGNILCLKKRMGDSLKLTEELRKNNIDVSVREGNIRLSFHVFNTKEQVQILVEALDRYF